MTSAAQTFCPVASRKYVLVAAVIGSAMGFIDGTVVSIAIPAIRADLSASLGQMQWVNNAYMLTLSALILLGGAAGDRYGVVRLFGLGILLFVAASVACALAPNAEFLIAARGLQGIGAAAMVPGSLALISKAYPQAERGAAIGIWAAASAVTTALGPAVGGAVLSLDIPGIWRAIFAINLPIGAIAFALLWWRIPRDAPDTSEAPDYLGGLLATLGLGALAWAMTGRGGDGDGPALEHLLWFGSIGLMLTAAFLWVETRARRPMMPLRLFALPGFAAANALTFALYFALSAVLFFLPMTLVTGWGISEFQTILAFAPLSIFIGLLSSRFGRLADRIGPKPLIALGSLLAGLAFAGLALTVAAQDFWGQLLPLSALMGLGMALVVAPLSAAVMGAVAYHDTGAASGINNAMSRISGLFAVASMGGVAAYGYGQAGGMGSFGEFTQNAAAMNAGFALVAWWAAGLSLLSALIALVFLRR
ncbi:EmrB/QacA subfamily drug resistance transporter [Rubricella aquisinus]|uniref:EmrB/QacA subfamily drug resistance transporter n=1 Tax=Rubricella aquisinus TaxID=2028108 RepID=A0A840WYM5_9RHOB|nr:MFS transporter [Rubricella aquisinus]MBB5514766.1 EmrB/QacA subfamily drug resistance transporter [Rubricella aquisinus]